MWEKVREVWEKMRNVRESETCEKKVRNTKKFRFGKESEKMWEKDASVLGLEVHKSAMK